MSLVETCKKALREHFKNTVGEEFNALSDTDTELLKKVKDSSDKCLAFTSDMVFLVNRGYLISNNGKVCLSQKGESALESLLP